MSNKRYDQFGAGTPTSTRIILHADPSTGTLEKCAISALPGANSKPPPYLAALNSIGCPIVACILDQQTLVTNSAVSINSGSLFFGAVALQGQLLNGGWISLQNAANVTSNNFNGMALYEYSAGFLNRVAITANDPTLFTAPTSNYKPISFTAQYQTTSKMYWIALLFNWSAFITRPSLYSNNTSTLSSTGRGWGMPTGVFQYRILNSQTAFPTSIDLSTMPDNSAIEMFFGVW